MKKLFFQLILFTFAVIGWVVYSHWGQIQAFGERIVSIGEDLAGMAKNSGMMPPTTIESGQPQSDAPRSGGSVATVYKWQDSTGRWHFGDSPPPGAINVKQQSYAVNENVMKPVDIPEPEPEPEQRQQAAALGSNGLPTNTGIPGIPNPNQVQELMNRVNNLQGQLNQRNTQGIEQALGDGSSYDSGNSESKKERTQPSKRILSN